MFVGIPVCLLQAVNSWVRAFAFDASNENDGGVDSDGGGFLSEGDGDGDDPEDMAALQMECTVHEVLLKNQVGASVPFFVGSCAATACFLPRQTVYVRTWHSNVRMCVGTRVNFPVCALDFFSLPTRPNRVLLRQYQHTIRCSESRKH